MPFTSERQALLSDLQKLCAFAFLDDDEELLEDAGNLYTLLCASRYLNEREPRYRSQDFVLNHYMTLPEPEFRQITRTSRVGFISLLRLIEDNPIFYNNSACPQTSPTWQLAVALARLGQNGNGASIGQIQRIFGIGAGTVCLFTKRVIEALLVHRRQWLTWPSAERRSEISRVLREEGFPGCVGFVDGTPIPLAQRPALDAETYWDRKKRYSVAMQVCVVSVVCESVCQKRRSEIRRIGGGKYDRCVRFEKGYF